MTQPKHSPVNPRRFSPSGLACQILSSERSRGRDFPSDAAVFVMVARNRPSSRRSPRRGRSHPTVFALLWLDSRSASALRAALEEAGLHPQSLLSDDHLTVDHARRSLPELRPVRRTVSIDCNLAETRTMVLVPRGENPRLGVIPSRHSLALRHTRRNVAVPEIQALRAELTVHSLRDTSSRRGSMLGARRTRATKERTVSAATYACLSSPRGGISPTARRSGTRVPL